MPAMDTSTRRGISYPDAGRTAAPDVPAHIANLITFLDKDIPWGSGTEAAKPAAGTVVQGMIYWATDSSKLYINTGSWTQIPLNGSPIFTGTPQAPQPSAADNSAQIATTQFVRTIVPPGVIMEYGGAAAPTGWLLCDGSSQLRAGALAALFAVIGTTYGSVDGTHFNLPDLRRRVPVGKDASTPFNTLGAVGGEEAHTLTDAELPAHDHDLAIRSHLWPQGTGGNNTYVTDVGGVTGAALGTDATAQTAADGGGGAHNNIQPFIVLNYIIKT